MNEKDEENEKDKKEEKNEKKLGSDLELGEDESGQGESVTLGFVVLNSGTYFEIALKVAKNLPVFGGLDCKCF
jgi:hypothetical protein